MSRESCFLDDPVVKFFHTHAGFGYKPGEQTEAEGKLASAIALAQAERAGSDAGLTFDWSIDDTCDSSEFDDSGECWALWRVLCRDESGEIVCALGGIDFGNGVEPWGQPYRRVVEAELSAEYLSGLPV